MEWTLETTQDDGVLHVVPRGELDLLTAPLLARALHEAERHEDRIRLDLRGLSFMDSSGLAVVLEAVSRSRERPTERLDILVDGGVVVRVLELAHLMDDLPLVR
ncbi:hypothetical protein DSM112329_03327 [Paraconexibacter sp. AEG42_29]|uniref:Anti-sigma factor antagonist n=1 Tax=Paraconexibacter sp. AEG42_29 TaxID=2997339 RepID=A0AAU7AXK8_9ACTN